MSDSSPSDPEASGRAHVPWGDLVPDVVLLGIGVLAMVVSLVIDISAQCHNYFARSGAIAILMSGVLAYRSLTKHYEKFFNYPQRQVILRTSPNQLIIDRYTLALSIIGTLVWAYGDKLFPMVCK